MTCLKTAMLACFLLVGCSQVVRSREPELLYLLT